MMVLLSFRTEAGTRLGVRLPRGVLDVERARALMPDRPVPTTLEALLDGGQPAREALAALVERAAGSDAGPWWRDEASLRLAPCVPRPGKILCIGLNYRGHAAETGARVPEVPVVFCKLPNAVAAAGDVIPLPPDDDQIDYEGELALVIGRRARHVPRREALAYVFGYCNANDLSARRLQFGTGGQWLLGKTPDGFCPLGPYLVTADQVPDPQDLRLRSYVNGQLRQDAHTGDMIFPCDYLVAYLSRYLTLEPGDVILTGTPQGVALGRPDRPWLRPGDRVAVTVDGLGVLENVIGEPLPAGPAPDPRA